uniref:Uncharacterized protein n=1 Tax=Cacopsylla melanoneura TaxID=428564 RepID=A0A8D8R276_9HEMI
MANYSTTDNKLLHASFLESNFNSPRWQITARPIISCYTHISWNQTSIPECFSFRRISHAYTLPCVSGRIPDSKDFYRNELCFVKTYASICTLVSAYSSHPECRLS